MVLMFLYYHARSPKDGEKNENIKRRIHERYSSA